MFHPLTQQSPSLVDVWVAPPHPLPGHSIYQLTVMFLLVFYGDVMFSIPNGRMDPDNPTSIPSQHYTIVFNAFVLMQLFNELNARIINDNLSYQPACISDKRAASLPWRIVGAFFRPLVGVFTNMVFVSVVVGTTTAQVVLVEV